MNYKKLQKKIHLQEGEEIAEVVRQYPLSLFWQIIFAFILVILPFFLMFLLLSWGSIGLFLFAFLLAVALFYSLKVFNNWYFNIFIITNYRIIDIDQKKFFDKTVSGITYDKIQDISYHQKGLGQTLFKYGSVQLQLVNANTKIKLEKIYQPEKVQQLLTEMQRYYKGPQLQNSENSLLKKARKEAEELSAGELNSLYEHIGKKIQSNEKEINDFLNNKDTNR